tara:strand:- start:3104 stop:3532 length:429 start_codon:yes stop_codon:yes gene_type:complete
MATFYSPRTSGIGNSAAYQVAGKPYLTGSTLNTGKVATVTFPTISRSFTLVNTGSGDLRIYFDNPEASPGGDPTEAETQFHRFTLAQDASITMNVKCAKFFVKAVAETGFECVAELTHIPSEDMYILTGSGINAPVFTNGLE